MRQSITEYLADSSRHGGGAALVWRRGYRTERWSYARLRGEAQRIALLLARRGVERSERVLLWGANSGECVAAFWGVLLRGAVVVPLDKAGTPAFARSVAGQVNPRLLLVDTALRGAFDGTEFASRVVELDLLPGPDEFPAPSDVHPPIARTDIAQIIFTSGSTAEPKGVVLTHGNLLANLEPLEVEIAKYLKYERWVHPLRFLEMLPLSHVFGQFMGLFVPQLLGATVIFSETLNPSEVIRTARREKVTLLVAVPRLLESVRGKLEQGERDAGRTEKLERDIAAAARERFWWRWWRFRRMHSQLGWRFWAVVSGGAALGRETELFWQRLGYLVIQGYGLTETASLITLRHPFKKGDGSIGQALAGREVKLDEHGEILVRGENVAAGYWRGAAGGPDALQPIVESSGGEMGWFRTGDLGEVDAAGNLYFKGRKKNVLVTAAGMNIYPEDIEAALRAQPEVRDCAVVVIKVEGREEACAALLLRVPADSAAVGEIVARANQRLAEYQRLRYWQLWPHEDLPRTSTGKPRLNLIREALQAGFAPEKSPAADVRPAAASSLEEILRRMGRSGSLSAASTLEGDLRLSSIDRVELLSEIEDRLQTDLNEAAFTEAKTLGDLEKLLQQPGRAASPDFAPVSAAYPYVRWPRHWAVRVIRELAWWILVLPAMLLLGWPRGRGRERLRGLQHPLLLIANHQTEIDAAFLLATLPGRLRRRMAIAMVGERLRDMRHPPAGTSWLKRLYDPLGYALLTAFFHVFPLPKQSGVRGSFEYIGELMDQGWSVMIFPEGQLTKDGKLGPFRSGIGVLARSLGLPVVPAKLSGLYELRCAGRRHAGRGEIQVGYGEPLRFAATDEPEAIAGTLREAVEGIK